MASGATIVYDWDENACLQVSVEIDTGSPDAMHDAVNRASDLFTKAVATINAAAK